MNLTQAENDEIMAAWLRMLPELLRTKPWGSWAVLRTKPGPVTLVSVHPLKSEALSAGYRISVPAGCVTAEFVVQEIKPDPVGEAWLAARDAAEVEYASWVVRPGPRALGWSDLQRIEVAKVALGRAHRKLMGARVVDLQTNGGAIDELERATAALTDAELHWGRLMEELRSRVTQI